MEKLEIKTSSRSLSHSTRVFIHPKTMNSLRVGASEPLLFFAANESSFLGVGLAWPSMTTDCKNVDISPYLKETFEGIDNIVCVYRVDDALMESASVSLEPTTTIKPEVLSNALFQAHLQNHLLCLKYIKVNQMVELPFAGKCYRFTATSVANKDALVYPRYYLSNLTNPELKDIKTLDLVHVIVEKTEIKVSKTPVAKKDFDSSNLLKYTEIGGMKSQIKIVRETIETPLHNPEVYTQFGLKPPKGVLLHGPPGTGKTLIARVVAAQTRANFLVLNGAELMSKYVGETEEKIRHIFMEAREKSPSIIFIDEIDSLCSKRDDSNSETEKRIVATFLTLLDGLSLDENKPIVVLAATNRPNSIDPALRRPGRFDKEVEIGVPNPLERLEILQILLRKIPNSVSEDELKHLADSTHGYVGADLAAVVREAGMAAIKRWQDSRNKEDLSDALSSISLSSSSNLSCCLGFNDLLNAKTIVRPSAMREITLEIPETRWEDIGGMEEQKMALKESILYPLKYPQTFARFNMSAPKGILLYGPPGCSKTLLAKALATEAEHNFFLIKAGEIFNPYVGESERTVREVFRKAKLNSPSIIFFDEIDAIAVRRSSSSNGSSSNVGDRVLTTLLTEMDGVESLEHVFVLAATNRPDVLDSALMRPGRFDRLVYVSPPDAKARFEIFKIQKMRIEVSLDELVEKTDGWTGAEIVGLCREAALAAIRNDPENANSVKKHDFDQAFTKIKPRITIMELEYYKRFERNI